MIRTQGGNSNPMTHTGGVFKLDVSVIKREDTEIPLEFDFDTGECDYVERAFAKTGGEDFENDKSAFLFSKSLPTDTVTIKLFKDNIEIAIITDDTYGTFFPTFATQPLKVGFLLDWLKVFTLEGAGCFQIKSDKVIISQVLPTFNSVLYQLMPFDEVAARDTVVIKTFQNGNIEGGIDYTGMNWEQRFRILADFDKLPREYNIENYRDTNQVVQGVQHGIEKFFMLRTRLIPSIISEALMDDSNLGNSIFITDYDVFANQRFIDLKVYPIEVDDEQYPKGQTGGLHNVKFSDVNRKRKRN